jgi:hypothetical protein
MTFWTDFGIGLGVILAMFVIFIIIAIGIGFAKSIKPPCPDNNRAISVDGSKSVVDRTTDYPFCSPIMSCPTEGLMWAVHADGSALTNSCEYAYCSCTAFRHCPAFASTVFRQFGSDERISLFQIIDPLATEKEKPTDPYDTPYLLKPGSKDFCFLSPTTIDMLSPPLALGGACIRGTLAKMSTVPSQYVCAPSAYVSNNIFNVEAYMNVYRSK